jgi:hypothetical protein
MSSVQRYAMNSPEYTDAFSTLAASSGGDSCAEQLVRNLAQGIPRGSCAVDWGAGVGHMTELLLEAIDTVYAVEPNSQRREQLQQNCPRATVIDGTIASFTPPRKVQLGLICHVYYHIPDHKWGAYTIRAARHVAEDGALLITLQAPDSEGARMLAHFGAPPFDLQRNLADVMRAHPEFDFTWSHGRNQISTTSFENTLKIARFMLSDRAEDNYSRAVSESEFRDYVRSHFWNEEQCKGGWNVFLDYCVVRRNSLLTG